MEISPQDYLKQSLDPIGAQLDGVGAPHLLFGLLPGPAVLHIVCNAKPADKIVALREAANALLDYAAQIERQPKSSLILPGVAL